MKQGDTISPNLFACLEKYIAENKLEKEWK